MVHPFNPIPQEAEAESGRSLWNRGQLGLGRPSQKTKTTKGYNLGCLIGIWHPVGKLRIPICTDQFL